MQCRKLLCLACTVVTPAGRFCSTVCSTLYRQTKAASGVGRPRWTRSVLAGLCFLLVLIALVLLAHIAARRVPEDHWLKRVDVLGRYLERANE